MIHVFRAGSLPAADPSTLRRGNALWATRIGAAFAIASFLAVGAGCMAARSAGVGTGVWARNVGAWAIGALSTPLVARVRPYTLFRAVMVLTPLALLLSLFSRGQSGVHRWILLGPLAWNIAFLLLPAASVAFAATARSGLRWILWAALVIQVELWVQPDASQATAFAAALIVALWTTRYPGHNPVAASLFLGIAAVFAWSRPDPLAPVPEVEDIIKLAGAHSMGMAALSMTSLAAVTVSPLCGSSNAPPGARPSAIALCVYFLICSLMRLFGAFPVPIVGLGMSPIIGFWLGIATLSAMRIRPAKPPRG